MLKIHIKKLYIRILKAIELRVFGALLRRLLAMGIPDTYR
jgi:hypothetical protein